MGTVGALKGVYSNECGFATAVQYDSHFTNVQQTCIKSSTEEFPNHGILPTESGDARQFIKSQVYI